MTVEAFLTGAVGFGAWPKLGGGFERLAPRQAPPAARLMTRSDSAASV